MMLKQKGVSKLNDARGASQFNLPEDVYASATEALKLNPDLADAQILWARAVLDLKKKSDYRAAKERLLRAKAKLTKNPEPCFLLGRLYQELNDRTNAEREFSDALKRDPQHRPSKEALEDF